VYCLVDGQEIGYSKVLTRGSSSTFTGFMEAGEAAGAAGPGLLL
jgi:hypothetical protein